MSKASDRKDESIIAALISTQTVRAAATACGISESQIYKRLRDPVFTAKYDRARLDLISQATANMQGLLGEAIQKIRGVMNDSEASQQTQLNAADAILRHCYRMTEQADVLKRLDDLEAAAREAGKL